MVISVGLEHNSYEIQIKRGILSFAKDYIDLGRRVLIVTDSGVPREYSECIARQCKQPFVEAVASGERSKNFANMEKLLSLMLTNSFSRKDCVVAVGGGVVGDLAGFVAATYMRGVDFYNIPTTVLSQVDSSVGGKTAIDLNGVKNVVGTFYQPKAVLIDPSTLGTLSQRQISNGLAEAVKMSLIGDADLFTMIEKSDPEEIIDEVIKRSVRAKVRIVEIDEKESNLRRVLNFGHTIGHAIESYEELHGLLHGECVGIGMLPMCSDGLRPRVENVLKRLRLPTACHIDSDRIIRIVSHDKKADGDYLTAIIVDNPGEYIMKTVSLEEIRNRLNIIAR